MPNKKSVFGFLTLIVICSKVAAGELVSGKIPGSIMLRDNGLQVVYENIIGKKDCGLMDVGCRARGRL